MSAMLESAPEQSTISTLKTVTGAKIKTKDDFYRFVRKRREAVQKSQAQIAKALDYNSGEYWALVESGKRRVDQEKVPQWADALELNRSEFTKLYLKLFSPNIYYIFWGKEELELHAPETEKSFVRIDEQGIEIVNKLNRMSARDRKNFIIMLNRFVEFNEK